MKNYNFDCEYKKHFGVVAGCDEAGRGPLAGPVVVASVIMPLEKEKLIYGIDDSKKLSAKKRELLFKKIVETAVAFSIKEIDNQTIDKINIFSATKLCMENSINNLTVKPDLVLVDAMKNLKINCKQEGIIKGDAMSYNIASASILAKVYRDKLMTEFDKIYPNYNFKQHKGYGTKEHIENLHKFGFCKLHRQTFLKHFSGVKKADE